MKAPKVGKITFAIVDVRGGRKALAKLVKDHKRKIPITLKGHIVGQWSGDDGVSIEFDMDVTSQKIGKPVVQHCICVRCKNRVHTAIAERAALGRAKIKDRSDPEGGIPGRQL